MDKKEIKKELFYLTVNNNFRMFNCDKTNMSSELFKLIQKADSIFKLKFKKGFPLYVEVFDEWYNSSDPKEYFKEFLETSK